MENQQIIDNETYKNMIDMIKKNPKAEIVAAPAEAKAVKKKRKTKVAPTSVIAYGDYKHNEEQVIAEKRLTDKDRIVNFIKEYPGCTREQIAEGTGIKLQTVTGNVTQLIRKCRIKEGGTTLNRSGRKVGRLWPVSE
jgi:hypothetical protein